ncbi:MAG: type II toxin-antitoxin system HicA family toxin [Gammaproteobacteria bacterium]|nr:MAG: type II toxin-antitoxin system HicA family toxin [Gammaproteobacteria bacterium]
MGKAEKLKAKLLHGSTFRWAELVTLLDHMGYTKYEGSGSRVKFTKNGVVISLHRPHPSSKLKRYTVRNIIDHLRKEGEL